VAEEFNVTPDDQFFLGEDKIFELSVYESDGVTPLDVIGIPLEWSLKKTDRAADPGIIAKGISAGGVSTGITIVGVFNADPNLNTQKVRITFTDDDTDPAVTSELESGAYTLRANRAYRHSLKRMDSPNENVLMYGSVTFLQATER